MLKLRSWTTSRGKRRVVRLYNAYKNMLARVRGTGKAGNGANYWVGKEVGFKSFEHFREWALANGYSRTRCSLDRRNHLVGYTPANCQWLTVVENTIKENTSGWMQPGDPENHPFCPF